MTMIWCRSMEDSGYTKATIESEGWFQAGISVFDCQPVARPFPDVTLKVKSRHPPGDFFEPGTVFTISDCLKAVLEEFQVPVEFFPVRVIYKDREYDKQRYFFCNTLECVDCLDLTRGEYTY